MSIIPYYLYKITCVPTGEYYYGSRYKHVQQNYLPEDDLWIRYYSSSRLVSQRIKEFGKDNFLADIIQIGHNLDEIFWAEQELIKNNIHDSLCLNKHYVNRYNARNIFLTAGMTSWIKDGMVTFGHTCPGEGWSHGGSTSGTTAWNKDGVVVYNTECPGKGWEKGAMKWWVNGDNQILSVSSPGDGWKNTNQHKGSKSWHKDGKVRKSFKCPGDGWLEGSIPNGTTAWNKDGKVRYSVESPGVDWAKGHTTAGNKSWIKDGVTVFSKVSPGEGWEKRSKNKGKLFWIKDGVVCRSEKCPGEGWYRHMHSQGLKTWTKDGVCRRSADCPGSGWEKGGLVYWQNGDQLKRSAVCPGDGWTRKIKTHARKDPTTKKGKLWWTNGIDETVSHNPPDANWYRGRTK